MRISDWSSDVCSSDLPGFPGCSCVIRTRPDPFWIKDLQAGRGRMESVAAPSVPSPPPGPVEENPQGQRNAQDQDASGRGQALPEDRFRRSEEHTSELQSLMRTSSPVFCFIKHYTLLYS